MPTLSQVIDRLLQTRSQQICSLSLLQRTNFHHIRSNGAFTNESLCRPPSRRPPTRRHGSWWYVCVHMHELHVASSDVI